MVMQPALPGFFLDNLHLSYTELGVAITLCKSIGFAMTSTTLWARLMNKMDIYRLSSWVALVACLYSVFLLYAQVKPYWVYIAYISYGIMQAGSELYWNMSGPIFAKDEDSTGYTSVNVLMVGLRGCIMPAMGGLLALWVSPSFIVAFGGVLLFLAMERMIAYSRQYQVASVQSV